jgi:hypothetical protein
MSGLYSLMPHLREAFKGPGFDHGYPELYPVFEELPSGDVVVKHHTYPEPGMKLAPDLKSVDYGPAGAPRQESEQ